MKRRICRVPGCEAKLARGNISTVCVNHMHAPLSEWLKPLSAQMINRRMHTGGSTVAPSLHGSRLSKSGSLRGRVNA